MSADDKNPYPEDKPELRSAWNEGYATAWRNESIPKERIYHDDDKEQAWVQGYTEGQMIL